MPKAVKRRYTSTRRDEQARETRLRIIGAARELFVTNGYGRTTLVEIAREAAVAVETRRQRLQCGDCHIVEWHGR